MNQEPEKSQTDGNLIGISIVLGMVLCGLIYDSRKEILAFLKPILFFTFGIIFLSIFLLALAGKNPFRSGYRRFKKGHLLTRLAAYFGNPERLTNAVENIDRLDEIDSKVEYKSLTRMAYELEEARLDYESAVSRCKTKEASRAVKEAYFEQTARIKAKYRT